MTVYKAEGPTRESQAMVAQKLCKHKDINSQKKEEKIQTTKFG